jgi:hypothetical protein
LARYLNDDPITGAGGAGLSSSRAWLASSAVRGAPQQSAGLASQVIGPVRSAQQTGRLGFTQVSRQDAQNPAARHEPP